MKRPLLTLLAVSSVLLNASPAFAQYNWSGLGGDNSWTTGGNWVGGTAPNQDFQAVFTGATRLTPVNNLPAGRNVRISFAAGATGAFTLSGNAILVGGAITNDSTAATQTIALDLVLGQTRVIQSAAGGTVHISGAISGTGHSVALGGYSQYSGTVILSGANTYSGKTSIRGGTVSVSSFNSVSNGSANSSLGAPITVDNATINLGAQATSARLQYTGAGEVTDRIINLNGGDTSNPILDQSGTAGLLKFTSDFTATAARHQTLTLQGSTAGTGEIAGAIVDPSSTYQTSLTKAGTGTWTLSGQNTYTGVTTVSAGTLLLSSGATIDSEVIKVDGGNLIVNGTLRHGAVTVANGATLGGSGTITGALHVANGGRLTPGNSPGVLHTGNLSLATGSIFSAEITGPNTNPGVDYDQLNVTGSVSLDGDLALSLNNGLVTVGSLYFLIVNDGMDAISGAFANINGGSTDPDTEFELGGQRWRISYQANYNNGVNATFTGGNDVALLAIPEPSAWILTALALIGMGALRQRSRVKI